MFEGRYNQPGEWKPFAKGRDERFAERAAIEMAGDADYLIGPLFYVFYTNCRGLEFVARVPVELPSRSTVLHGGRVQLWQCDPPEPRHNTRVYDGWVTKVEPTRESVEEALQLCGSVLNRLVFFFSVPVTWRVKYTYIAEGAGVRQATADHEQQVRRYLEGGDEQIVAHMALDRSIDWYTRAQAARGENPLLSFLAFYVSIESVAIAHAEGTSASSLAAERSASQKKADREACVRELHATRYEADPEGFVRDAYFDCVVGLRRKTEQVVAKVLGNDHEAIQLLFGRPSGEPSLADLRASVAHGRVSLLSPADEQRIKKRLPGLARVARAFLGRLIVGSTVDSGWTGRGRSFLPADDPRSMWMMSPALLLQKDWTIRPEWCDP